MRLKLNLSLEGMKTYQMPSPCPLMLGINITWQGMKQLMEGVDSGKSPGHYDISSKLLKLILSKAANFSNLISGNV